MGIEMHNVHILIVMYHHQGYFIIDHDFGLIPMWIKSRSIYWFQRIFPGNWKYLWSHGSLLFYLIFINMRLLSLVMSWYFARLFSRWKVSSLESKSWPCSTAVFHAALQNILTLCNLYLSHFSMDWAAILQYYHLGGKNQVYRQQSKFNFNLN